MKFLSPKLAQKYYQCLGSTITVHFNSSFLLALALKLMICVMALFVPALSKFSPNLIEIPVPYKLLMGS